MRNRSHRVKEELSGIVVFIGVIWGTYMVNLVFFPIDFNTFGLVPRTLHGAIGIPLMPFLHGSLWHLLSNTVPLVILLALLAGSQARSWEIVGEIVLLGGVLLWVFGRGGATHVGASALIFGLIAFLIVAGPLEKRLGPMAIAVLVAVLYGGTLLWGVLPISGPRVSWDGHLCGAAAGGLIAFARAKGRPQRTTARRSARW